MQSKKRTKGLYSLYDRVGEVFSPPVLCENDGVAMRMFKLQMEKTQFPEDFRLFHVGEFDEGYGTIAFGDVNLEHHEVLSVTPEEAE